MPTTKWAGSSHESRGAAPPVGLPFWGLLSTLVWCGAYGLVALGLALWLHQALAGRKSAA